MQLRDLVGSAPYLCGPETTVVEAARAMEESDIGSLAVVDGRSLVGLFTERDIRRAIADGRSLDTAVAEVMSSEPDTFDPDLDVWDAAAWISESGYRHLPVVDDDGELLAVVSIRDLLRGLVGSTAEEE